MIEGSNVDIPGWLRMARRDTCEACEYHNKSRCQKIDLGCRKTFIDNLGKLEGTCPEGKWENLEMTPKGMPEVVECAYIRRTDGTLRCVRCGNVVFTPQPPLMVHTPCRWQPAGMDIEDTNLIYHVCPLKSNDHWIKNIDQLTRRWTAFSNKKIIAISVGDDLHPSSDVKIRFPGDAEFIEVPNDVKLREVASFPALLTTIKEQLVLDHESAVFYAHTKGNSTNDGEEGAELWRNAMYHFLLDHKNSCLNLLKMHPCVGTTKLVWPKGTVPPYPTKLMLGEWMYAGTFYWFRGDIVFSRDDWDMVADDRYAAEAWLSGMFEVDEAPTVFQPWRVFGEPYPNPYDPKYYTPFMRAFE